MIEALVPGRLATTARRASTLLITFAVMVWFLFPVSGTAGTETRTDRIVTTALLAVAGLAIRFTAERGLVPLAILALHGVVQFALGTTWAAIASLVLVLWGAASFVRRPSADETAGFAPEDTLTVYDHVRENVEAIVMALILALTVKTFVYEAFQIPTSSMEPTILGANARKEKPGDRLLASKVRMLFGDPSRWSIIVFKYPLFRPVNYIKRLVGLPGDHMEIKGGDIYIDGAVADKPDVVQETLWFPLYPARDESTNLANEVQTADDDAEWTITATAATADVPVNGSSFLRFRQSLGAEDLRVRAIVSVDEFRQDGHAVLSVEGGGRKVEVGFGPDGGYLDGPGVGRVDVPAARIGTGATEIGLGVADRVARIYVGGHIVARIRTADERNGGKERGGALLGLRAAKGSYTTLRADRDIEYEGTWDFKIPEDCFVMLGDNTGGSKDSRKWHITRLTTADGRVYEGEDMVKVEDGSTVRLQKTSDGKSWRFLDVDGILREIPVEGTRIDRNVPAPFVHRRDLVGRAFVIFFPFPPIADWRPQFLP